MKKLILILTLGLGANSVYGQSDSQNNGIKRNTIYVEAFGQGLYNSFAFDRLFRVDKKIKTSFTAGLTLIPSPELTVVGVPLSFNWLFGQKNNHLELGIGITAMYLRQGQISASEYYVDQSGQIQYKSFKGHSTDFYSYFTPKIGYRFQKSNGGMFFRATFTPAIAGINKLGSLKGGNDYYHWNTIEYFTSAAFFGSRIMPWAGISLGWTFRK